MTLLLVVLCLVGSGALILGLYGWATWRWGKAHTKLKLAVDVAKAERDARKTWAAGQRTLRSRRQYLADWLRKQRHRPPPD